LLNRFLFRLMIGDLLSGRQVRRLGNQQSTITDQQRIKDQES